MTPWYESLAKIKPLVFKVETSNGFGTGFLIFNNNKLCGIATAYHVISEAYEWDFPIKLTHHESGSFVKLKPDSSERAIFSYPNKDLAIIIVNKTSFPNLESSAPELIPADNTLKEGVSVGWCGFPAIAASNLCFFAGHTSSYLADMDAYLADGVAINGVSGGPAFFVEAVTLETKIYGVVSEYRPNRRLSGETTPGLCVIRSVEPYRQDLENLKSMDEASEKAEIQSEKAEKELEIAKVEEPKVDSEITRAPDTVK